MVNGNTGKTALVTGGCGFVGRNVVRRLLRDGYKVWIVDDLSTGQEPSLWLAVAGSPEVIGDDVKRYGTDGSVTLISGDVRAFLRDASANGSELSRFTPSHYDVVVHLAAVVGGRAKIEGDPLSVALDLSIDAEFFYWAAKAKPGRILYASSSAVYPTMLQEQGRAVPLEEHRVAFEDTLGVPDLTYGWSKLTGEYLARIAARHYGLKVACVRPFSGYGEEQDVTYPIPAIARRAARREDPLTIWGSGNQGRDFVHIDDCIDAMMLALEKVSDGSGVNIGSGKLTTFREVAQIFAELVGYKPEVVALADKPQGVHARFADTRLSRQLLGWEPRISLREGFRRVLDAVAQAAPK